jgi:hypothetical protein
MTALFLLLAWFFQPDPVYTVGGAIVNATDGKPLAKARVFMEFERSLNIAPVITGADGRFSFTGLPRGRFRLSAERLGFSRQAYRQPALDLPDTVLIVTGSSVPVDNLVFPLIPGAVISGFVTNTAGDPIAGMDVNALGVRGTSKRPHVARYATTTDDRGYYRLSALPGGSFVLVVSGKPWQAQEVPTEQPSAYPMTYFPDTTDREAAGRIHTSPGQETRVDVKLTTVPAVKLIGLLPHTAKDRKRFITIGAPSLFGGALKMAPEQTVEGDQAVFDQIPAGPYHMVFMETGDPAVGFASVHANPGLVTRVDLAEAHTAQVTFTVTVTGLPPTAPPLVVALESLANSSIIAQPVDADHRTVFKVVPPDRYAVRVTLGRSTAPLASVAVAGEKQPGEIIEVPETGNIEVSVGIDVFAGQVSGTVLRKGVPQAGALVLLAKRDEWELTAAYRHVVSATDGSFTWAPVSAGEYLMFAVESGQLYDYDDPESIRKILPTGKPLTVLGRFTPPVRLELPSP